MLQQVPVLPGSVRLLEGRNLQRARGHQYGARSRNRLLDDARQKHRSDQKVPIDQDQVRAGVSGHD